MAGIYDYINQFWAEAERSPFNPTEVALYHYLLYEAKHRKKGKDAFEENLAKYTGISDQGNAIWLPKDVKNRLEIVRINASRNIPLRSLAAAIIMTYIEENEEKLNGL
mgnify:CR=1 FL=1